MYKNFKLDSVVDNNSDLKSKIMGGKGLTGILGMIQKNANKNQSPNMSKNNSETGGHGHPSNFSPNRRKSSFYSDKRKFVIYFLIHLELRSKMSSNNITEHQMKSDVLSQEEIIKIHEQMKDGKFDYYICTN